MTNIEHPERRGVQVNIPTFLIMRASTAQAVGVAMKARAAARTTKRSRDKAR
jgi:hypothetical protein